MEQRRLNIRLGVKFYQKLYFIFFILQGDKRPAVPTSRVPPAEKTPPKNFIKEVNDREITILDRIFVF